MLNFFEKTIIRSRGRCGYFRFKVPENISVGLAQYFHHHLRIGLMDKGTDPPLFAISYEYESVDTRIYNLCWPAFQEIACILQPHDIGTRERHSSLGLTRHCWLALGWNLPHLNFQCHFRSMDHATCPTQCINPCCTSCHGSPQTLPKCFLNN